MRMVLLLSLTLFTTIPGWTGATAVRSPMGNARVTGGWERLASLPDREGFAGSFAGVSGGALLVAGGSNFPAAKPWEGGKKVWYDTVFLLERPEATEWKVAGRSPEVWRFTPDPKTAPLRS